LRHATLEFADNVLFAGFAVEHQFEFFAAVDQFERFGLDGAIVLQPLRRQVDNVSGNPEFCV
jgi:hypothetical protein